jgi:cyclohexanecarboxyl-CoA dehydrogenase
VELRHKIARQGLMGVNLPESCGGQPADYVSVGIVVEELSRGDHVAAWYAMMPQILHHGLMYGTDEVQQEWLPPVIAGEKLCCLGVTEPDCGNDAAAMKTRALPVGDSFIVSGEKTSVSGGVFGDVLMLFAKTSPEAGARGVSCLLVPLDLPGVERSLIKDMGWHSLGRAAISLNEVRVPARYQLGEEGTGFYMLMRCFDFVRALVGLMGLGIAEAALDDTVAYAKQRTAFGRPILKFEAISFKLAEHLAMVEAARLLCFRTLWLKGQEQPHSKEGAMAKWGATETAARIVHDCLLMHGNFGYSEEYPVEQRLRDVIATEIMEGTHEIQKLIISREAFGAEFRPF